MNDEDFSCIGRVQKSKEGCKDCECRYWIDYNEDLNCTHIAIQKHGALKLQEVGDRLKVTAARIKQLEQESLKKISKSRIALRILE